MAKDSLSTFDESLIRTLASILEETGLSEIEYSKEGVKARVVKAYGGQVQVASSQPKPSQEPVIENTATVDQGTITAPMVGVVYICSSPEAAPFVKVGDIVEQGQILLLVEAMKVFNQIKSPKSGKVIKILIENGSPVEYGEPLIIIQ